MISFHFQDKPLNITVSQVYAPNTIAKEAEADQFYEDLRPSRTNTKKKKVLFIIEDWNVKVRSQEIPGKTGKFCLGIQNEARHELTEFCQENALIIANTLFQQHRR